MPEHNAIIHIAIVDDHPVVIEGLKKLLEMEPDFRVAAQFGSGSDFLAYLTHNLLDVALLDITLPDGNGIHFCREACKMRPDLKVMALSNLSEPSIVHQMLQSGAAGYLLKTATAKNIRDCIRSAMNGAQAISEEIKEIMAGADFALPLAVPDLTKREKQILALLATGKKTAEIATGLFISPLTVKTHRATLLQKFGTNNMVSLINRARECGLI